MMLDSYWGKMCVQKFATKENYNRMKIGDIT